MLPSSSMRRSAGVWLALLSALAFGSSGALAKSLIDTGWSSGAVVTLRIGGAALVLLVPAVMSLRGRWGMLRPNARLVTAYGLIAMAGCQVFFFNAVTTLSVGMALLLEYLGITLVVLWLWVAHAQRPRRWTLLGIALSVAGLLTILDLTGGMRVDLAGVLWGLAAAVGLAMYFVLSANQATGLPPIVMAAGGMTIATAGLLVAGLTPMMPMSFASGDPVLLEVAVPWFVPMLGLCLFPTALAYATGIAATRRLGSKIASFVGLTEVLFSVLFAWLLIGQVMHPAQVAGGVLILAGVVAVQYDDLGTARRAFPQRRTLAQRGEGEADPAAVPVPPTRLSA